MAITLNEAKSLEHGTVLYYSGTLDSKGEPVQWRVSGVPKTWKTRPEKVKVPVKYGLYGNAYITETDLQDFYFYQWEATGKKIHFRKETLEDGDSYYCILFKKEVVGMVYKQNGGWHNTRVDQTTKFRTRLEAAKHVMNCMY